MCWTGPGGKRRRHVPDCLVRRADGAVMVLDSRPQPSMSERDREAFAVTGRACTAVVGRYAVWDRLDGVVVANQRWLAGYRHPRCFDEHVAARLLAVFNQPRALMDGAELVGDPLGVLPVLYHLLWKQLLVADLVLQPAARRTNRHRDQWRRRRRCVGLPDLLVNIGPDEKVPPIRSCAGNRDPCEESPRSVRMPASSCRSCRPS